MMLNTQRQTRLLGLAIFLLLLPSSVRTQVVSRLTLTNSEKVERPHEAIELDLAADLGHQCFDLQSATVTVNGKETPCQLDDLDGDGQMDKLFFFADFPKKGTAEVCVELSHDNPQKDYPAATYAQLMLRNPKVKIKNQHDIHLNQLTVERGVNPYPIVHHHGVAFENELVAFRIYFDNRQTVDLYGKKHKGLELASTQFYTDSVQRAAGMGDDVLWVGQTFGLGALRGWDGQAPTLLNDVRRRSQRVVARGPLRSIVELKDEQWTPQPGQSPIDLTTRYTLYAGRRDCQVDVTVRKKQHTDSHASMPTSTAQAPLRFSTGLINVKNSVEMSNHKGLRGCWGTDWPVAAKDSVGHKRETVGLGILVPQANMVEECPANPDNYGFVISIPNDTLRYFITFGSDNETFGYHSAEEWFAYLDTFGKQRQLRPILIKVAK